MQPTDPAQHRELLRPAALSLNEGLVVRECVERISAHSIENVVEIGGQLAPAEYQALGLRPSTWTSFDPRARPLYDGGRRVISRPIEQSRLAADSTDLVFSCNALQFTAFRDVVSEVFRILRPGGVFYAHFGPIWSAPDGHQLEYVEFEGRELLFWRDTVVPPFAHLVLSCAEMYSLLLSRLPRELALVVVEHVYGSATINRLYSEEYLAILVGSGMELFEFVVSEKIDYEIVCPAYEHPSRLDWSANIWERVRAIHRRPYSVGPRDVRFMARKPLDSAGGFPPGDQGRDRYVD